MKKSVKNLLINVLIILAIFVVAIMILKKPQQTVEEKIATCIGENSILYTQLGCSHCKSQEELFGENYDKLNIIDCYFEKEICIEKEISGTPTWIINGEKYLGVQSIEKLKKLTNC